MDHWTETLFRNITDYVFDLDYLINTGADVDILVRSDILANLLGESDSVANLFNGICKNVTHWTMSSHFPFFSSKNLMLICRNPWHKLKATLRRDYCKTLWQTAASIAGILLVLTLLQSVCSVLQVVHQPNASGELVFFESFSERYSIIITIKPSSIPRLTHLIEKLN